MEHQNVFIHHGYRVVPPSDLESGQEQDNTPTTPLHPSGPFSNSANRNVSADYFNDHNAPGNETVNYYYVNAPPSREASPRQHNRNYGTLSSPGASAQAEETPPTYNEATRGDHKVQNP
ncbi:MAG: hypothetical protein M1831_001637 [Alyxoria varia]|nr:MAG: hypothetical protein M1831_001637 [Alyxoria varia]